MSTKSPAFVLAKDWGLHFHTLQSTNCVFPTSLLRIFPPTISNMVISDYYLSLFLSKRSKSSNPRALCKVGMRTNVALFIFWRSPKNYLWFLIFHTPKLLSTKVCTFEQSNIWFGSRSNIYKLYKKVLFSIQQLN